MKQVLFIAVLVVTKIFNPNWVDRVVYARDGNCVSVAATTSKCGALFPNYR